MYREKKFEYGKQNYEYGKQKFCFKEIKVKN